MRIISVNLSGVPFCSSCDSTRLNMSTKQFSQSLTHPNCEIPFVISNEWRTLRDSSHMGIYLAPKSGEVMLNEYDLMLVLYNDGSYEFLHVPPIKHSVSTYGMTLRNSLQIGTKFNAGDILYEYDAFRCGVPSSGYNTSTAYFPFFGYGHEDSIVVSEDFTYKARHKYVETVYLPIYEYTLLQKLYNNSIGYLPDIGDHINDNIVASWLLPIESGQKRDYLDSKSIKTKVLMMMQNMNLSDLITMQTNGNTAGFTLDSVKSNIEDGIVSGIKIHRLRKDFKLIDTNLQKSLEILISRYYDVISDVYTDLKGIVPEDKIHEILKQYYVYGDRERVRGDVLFKDAVYLIELEISDEHGVRLGDKVSSRHASKGVVSLILPSELRPITAETHQPIDYIYNPFGI